MHQNEVIFLIKDC